MSAIEAKELFQLKNEMKQTAVQVTASMNSFAREIKEGGLGDEMMTELTAEPKKQNWFKRLVNKILYTI